MIIFRVLSLVIIASSLMLLGADALNSLESGSMTLKSTAEVLGLIGQDPAAFQTLLSSGSLEVAAPVVAQTMTAPAWVPLGVIGLVLALIFRER
jgi:hypothetical protein